MANGKFKVVAERRLGTLNPDQQKIWSRLVARRNRLEATQQLLEEEETFFVDSVLKEYTQENHGAVRGIKLTKEGLLLQTYCECFRCQAQLQNLPPTLVVEEMVKQRLIDPEHVPGARKWAATTEEKFGKPVMN